MNVQTMHALQKKKKKWSSGICQMFPMNITGQILLLTRQKKTNLICTQKFVVLENDQRPAEFLNCSSCFSSFPIVFSIFLCI